MSEEEKQAIEILRSFEPNDLVECAIYLQAWEKLTNLIDKQQQEIEEKDKIINVMAEYISEKEILVDKHCYALTAEAIKQYFKKQVT